MDGASPAEGFLELPTQSGEWKRVCEDSLTERVAEVICGELGFPGFKEISYDNYTCASDQDNCTRAPSCNKDKYRLVDCTAQSSMCSSEKGVKIKCHEPGYKGCFELETVTLQSSSRFKFSSTAHCIYLCKTHKIRAIAIMDQTGCFCFTSADVHLEDALKCGEEVTSLSTFSVYDASVGFCEELNDTIGGSWDSNITWFGSIVHLTCIDVYSLKGNGTLQCVPGSSPLDPVWNDSKPDCIIDGSSTLLDRCADNRIAKPVILPSTTSPRPLNTNRDDGVNDSSRSVTPEEIPTTTPEEKLTPNRKTMADVESISMVDVGTDVMPARIAHAQCPVPVPRTRIAVRKQWTAIWISARKGRNDQQFPWQGESKVTHVGIRI
eukprot:XP_011675583.1 PREDICTED: uncharacterized protein LOC105443733 [Strongylocentrotus purpuratus]